MKIFHICETIKGGPATYLHTFDAVCRDQGQVRYVVPEQHLDQMSVQGETTTFDRPKRGIRSIWRLIREARRAARRERPDVLFFHSTYSLAALAAFRLFRVRGKFVYIPHGWARLRYGTRPLMRRLVSLIEGRLSRLADLTLCVSHYDQDVAETNGYGGRTAVVENALPDREEAQRANRFDPERINLLFVGRFDRQKGLDVLLDAWRAVAPARPDIALHILGDYVVESGARAKGSETDGPVYHGWVPSAEIGDYYASADLVVMPSRWEGLPMVLIEALRSGTPVMLSDVCGMGQLIGEGETGHCLPLDPARWSAAIKGLDKATLAAMRPACRELFLRRYSAERFRHDMAPLLAKLAGRQTDLPRAGAIGSDAGGSTDGASWPISARATATLGASAERIAGPPGR